MYVCMYGPVSMFLVFFLQDSLRFFLKKFNENILSELENQTRKCLVDLRFNSVLSSGKYFVRRGQQLSYHLFVFFFNLRISYTYVISKLQTFYDNEKKNQS